MDEQTWVGLITGQFGAIVILAIVSVVLWRRLLEKDKELKDQQASFEVKEEKARLKAEESDKETLGVLANLTKLLESFPVVSREQAERVIQSIQHAVTTITKHTEEHVKPGRKAAP